MSDESTVEKINEFRIKDIADIDDLPAPSEMEYGVLYIINSVQVVSYICPCGCGAHVGVNFDPKGWGLTRDDDVLTLHPSVLHRQCGAHYWVKKNKIQWC